ncbi:MAG: hypothetical protein ACRC1T_09940 [Clostridium chrysemydis]|uniref:hypothetical protein n=1 Tax=Clostridium chrysemydis TaxID=2665504 RepID=UPI003F34DB93
MYMLVVTVIDKYDESILDGKAGISIRMFVSDSNEKLLKKYEEVEKNIGMFEEISDYDIFYIDNDNIANDVVEVTSW